MHIVRYLVCVVIFVANVCSAVQYCSRTDLDCGGHDIKSFKTDDIQECKKQCNDDANCKSIQFYKGTCWNKNYACSNGQLKVLVKGIDAVKIDDDTDCEKEGYTPSESNLCHREEKDCGGHDIKDVGVVGLDVCKKLCDYNPACVSMQVLDNGHCWIKNYVCTNGQLRDFDGGNDYVKIGKGEKCSVGKLLEDSLACVSSSHGLQSHFYEVVHDLKLTQCVEECNNEDRCVAVTHSTLEACKLHDVNIFGDIYRDLQATYYQKYCCVYDNYRQDGGWYDHEQLDWETCVKKCRDTSFCEGITWDEADDCYYYKTLLPDKYYHNPGSKLYSKSCNGPGGYSGSSSGDSGKMTKSGKKKCCYGALNIQPWRGF